VSIAVVAAVELGRSTTRGIPVDAWNAGLRKAVNAMIPEVEGKTIVNTGFYDGGIYVCRRISRLHTDEDSFNGECVWVDPEEARPGELTDAMSISCDCVRLGPGWWSDVYFGWYFIYDPKLVALALAGDHSWVEPFLRSESRFQMKAERVDAPGGDEAP